LGEPERGLLQFAEGDAGSRLGWPSFT
jgi:hypothetical protein